MPGVDRNLALSATETELLRDLRSRLNRAPASKEARRVLATALFKLCARVGLEPEAGASCEFLTIQAVVNAASQADLEQLRSLVSALAAMDREHPDDAVALILAGGGQSIIAQRLVLAGKEQPKAMELAG